MPEQNKSPKGGFLETINGALGVLPWLLNSQGQISVTKLISGEGERQYKMAQTQAQLQQLQLEDIMARQQQAQALQAALPGLRTQAASVTGQPVGNFEYNSPEQLQALITNALSSKTAHGYQMAEIAERDRLADENATVAYNREGALIGQRKAAEVGAAKQKADYEARLKRDEMRASGNALSAILGDTALASGIVQNPTVANTLLQMEQKQSADKAAYASLQRILPELEKNNPAQAAMVKAQLDGVANIGFGSGTYASLLEDTQDTAFPKASKVETMDLTNSVLTGAQQGILDSTELLMNLDEMERLADPAFFTTVGTVQAYGEEVLQRLSPTERQAFYDQRDQLVASATDNLSQLLFKRSGAAVSATEEARAKRVAPTMDDSHNRFMSKLAAMRRGQARKRSLYLRVVTDGLSLESLRREEEKNNRILLGELEAIQNSGDDRMSPAVGLPTTEEWNSMTAEEKVRKWKEAQGGQNPAQ